MLILCPSDRPSKNIYFDMFWNQQLLLNPHLLKEVLREVIRASYILLLTVIDLILLFFSILFLLNWFLRSRIFAFNPTSFGGSLLKVWCESLTYSFLIREWLPTGTLTNQVHIARAYGISALIWLTLLCSSLEKRLAKGNFEGYRVSIQFLWTKLSERKEES